MLLRVILPRVPRRVGVGSIMFLGIVRPVCVASAQSPPEGVGRRLRLARSDVGGQQQGRVKEGFRKLSHSELW